ncbi:methyl-accepting chemotaxis protein [Clostridiaceae bacterium HSG29]|nr:methyl-accepting chemotaxis protein [Clostridiaceae bacterium HSG29]
MNIVIVGAGHGGKKLIEMFNEMENISIKLVIDKDFKSPGVILAKELNIKYSSEIDDIQSNVDILVDVTGSEAVRSILEKNYRDKTIIDSTAAALMVTMVDKQKEANEMLDEKLHVINETSIKLENEIANVSKGIKVLNEITNNLNNASSESKEYIDKTDELAVAINKITQRMKILGLNANIEAARAGEHGRGFSIVANEVQKMSDETANFALEIANLLKSIGIENENIVNEIVTLDDVVAEQNIMSDSLNLIVNEL